MSAGRSAAVVAVMRDDPYVVTDSCTACGACLLTCPEHAIVVGRPLRVRADRCTSCGECVEVCPADAVHEVEVEVELAVGIRVGISAPLGADHGVGADPVSVGAVQFLHDRGTGAGTGVR